MAYTKEQRKTIQQTIITKLIEGTSLKKILEDDDEMPSRPTIYEWLNPNSERFDATFSYNYAHAREESADVDADKIERVIDLIEQGTVDPAQGRAMMDGLKWIAGRKKPKKYGDKLDLTTGGKELTQQVIVYKLPDNQREQKSDEREVYALDENQEPIYVDETEKIALFIEQNKKD